MIGVPLIAFAVLGLTFSSGVIRGLNTVVVDADRRRPPLRCCRRSKPRPGVSLSARAEDLAAAMQAIRAGERDRRRLYPAEFRAGSLGRPAAAGLAFLQHPVPDPGQCGVEGPDRRPQWRHRRRRTQASAAPQDPGLPGGRAICPDQSGLQLCAIPAARRAAHGAPCGHRDFHLLCDRNRVLAARPRNLAALGRRKPADGPGRQAGAALRHLHPADGRAAAGHPRGLSDSLSRR